MISNFSSFVEFFAAIYVTMAVNNDFCSNFWTPKYYKEMDSLLKEYDFSGSSFIQDHLMDEIKHKYEIVQNRAHYRGFIVLILCIYYLIFMGFENDSNSISIQHYVPILSCTLLVTITLICSKYILRNWRWTIGCVLVYASIYITLKIVQLSFFESNEICIFIFNNKCILLVAIILLPIIHQLYIYWIFSSIYKGYLKYHVAEEYERYKKSMLGIRNKDKSLVDDIYLEAWTDLKFRTNEDPTLTSFYQVLNNQLLSVASPTHWQLLISWFKYHINTLKNKCKDDSLNQFDDNISSINVENLLVQYESKNNNTLDFSKEYNDYKKWKKTAGKNNNLKTYCLQYNLNYKDMTAWLRIVKPSR